MTDSVQFKEPDAGIFIAYTPLERVPDHDGKTISAGSQTLVNYIKGIKVSDINVGGYKANKNNKEQLDLSQVRTVRVEFDPESIGLSHPIAANLAPSDPGLKVLQDALENDKTVNVAIENIRKSKNSKTSAPIDPLTPMYHLLGADQPGTGSDMSIAGQNTSKVVAAVNGVTTSDCRSDALQWASLQKNRDGARSPEGFVLVQDKEDWTKFAYIVEDGEYTPRPSTTESNMDISGLLAALEKFLDEKLTVDQQGRYVKRPMPGKINEGKPWDTYTADKKINLGSYLASKRRYVYEWAFDYWKAIMESAPEEETLVSLTDTVLRIADKAQVQAYGGSVQVDRTVASHTEASRWAQWTIENKFSPWKENDEEWENEVAEYVSEKMRDCGDYALKSVQAENTRPQQASKSNADKMERLNKCLTAVNSNWSNADKLRAIYVHASKEELLSAPVEITEQGVVFAKGSESTLKSVLTAQGKALSQASAVEEVRDEGVETKQDSVEEVPSEPVEADVPAKQEDEPMSEDAFASLVSGQTEQIDWSAKLSEVESLEALESLWSEASSYLSEKVVLNGETMTLSNAFVALKNHFSNDEPNEKAQDLAEKAIAAESVSELQVLRKEAKEQNLLEVLVNDGQSDEEVSLDNVIKNCRTALRSSN